MKLMIKEDHAEVFQRDFGGESRNIFIYTYVGEIESAFFVANVSQFDYEEKFTI